VSVRLPLAFVLGIAAALLVACGGSNQKLLPPVSADRIKNHLAEIRQALDQQDCPKAEAGVRSLYSDLARIPNTVDRRLRTRLREGIDKLSTRVPIDCQQQITTTDTVPTTTTPAPTTDTTPTDTTTTTTTTETTTTPPPPPTDTTPTPTDTTPSGGGTPPGGVTAP
jgi:hypothetical protein